MGRPAREWLLLVLAAILGGVVALTIDRLLMTGAPGTLLPAANGQPTRDPDAVTLPTAPSTAVPIPPASEPRVEASDLRGAVAQQGGLLLLTRAERHTALAGLALTTNDYAVADRELVAARAALDRAFALVPEDLKQVIDGQRREVGRIRSELQLDPEGMDQRLRATQDLLLGLIVPPTP